MFFLVFFEVENDHIFGTVKLYSNFVPLADFSKHAGGKNSCFETHFFLLGQSLTNGMERFFVTSGILRIVVSTQDMNFEVALNLTQCRLLSHYFTTISTSPSTSSIGKGKTIKNGTFPDTELGEAL